MDKNNLLEKLEAYSKQREILITQLNQIDGILIFIQNELNKINSTNNSEKVLKTNKIS